MATFFPVFLLVLWSGSLADRLDRRLLILITQTVMMSGALVLGICLHLGYGSMSVIIPVTAVMGIAFVFNFPAWRAMIPDLVPRELMLNGIALDAAQFNLARSVGPLLGATIIAVWNVQAAFYLNAASFTAVIGALLLMHTRIPATGKASGTGSHIMEGVRLAWRESWCRNLLVLLGTTSFFGISFLVLLPGLSRDVLMRGSSGYGALLSAIGLGAVVGAPSVTLLGRSFRENTIVKATALTGGLAMLALGMCRRFWLCLFLAFISGMSVLMMSATINNVLQARVDRQMRGRIMSLYILVFQGIYPLGGMFLGYFSDRVSVPSAILLGGGVCTFAALVVIVFPSLLRDTLHDSELS